MAAALLAGPDAVLSHTTAAITWGIRSAVPAASDRDGPGGIEPGEIEITVPPWGRRPVGLRVHRRGSLPPEDRGIRDRLPVTAPIRTLIDLARRLGTEQLERAVNEADKLDLVDPETLRAALEARTGLQGVAALRRILDRRTFALTDSELERRFLRLVRRARLPLPQTGVRLNGFTVDFHWPELGLVVETDGLRYHRTPAQQARDRERDQAHAAAGLTPLRFTHAQITFEAERVVATLAAVMDQLRQ